jgi:LacI family transcriptional regulator
MIGLMQAVCDAGLGVPDQLAVVGFDDFEWADCFHPRLTVVAQPVDAIARYAVSLLGALIADPAIASRTICLQPSLIIRESCGGTMSR